MRSDSLNHVNAVRELGRIRANPGRTLLRMDSWCVASTYKAEFQENRAL